MSSLRSKPARFPWQRLASRLSPLSPLLKTDARSIQTGPGQAERCGPGGSGTRLSKLTMSLDSFCWLVGWLFFSSSPRQRRVQSLYAYVLIDDLNAWSVETRAPWERDGGRRGVVCGRGGVRAFQNTVRNKRIMCPINATVDHTRTPPPCSRGPGGVGLRGVGEGG